MKYKCCYSNDEGASDISLVVEKVEAESPEEACSKFENDIVNENVTIRPYIFVQWGGLNSKWKVFESEKWPAFKKEKEKNLLEEQIVCDEEKKNFLMLLFSLPKPFATLI